MSMAATKQKKPSARSAVLRKPASRSSSAGKATAKSDAGALLRSGGDDANGRNRILQSALKCFAEYGFKGATTRMIAQGAGVTPPLVLYHFATKENLWIETVHQALEEYLAHIEDIVARNVNKPARLALEEFIAHFIEFSSKNPEIHRIMSMQAQAEDRTRRILNEYVGPYFRSICDLIRRGQFEGSVRNGDPARIFYQIISSGTIFSIAYEYFELTGRDVFAKSEIYQTISHVMQTVFVD